MFFPGEESDVLTPGTETSRAENSKSPHTKRDPNPVSWRPNSNECQAAPQFRRPFRVFAIAKSRNNDANEKSSVPGFDSALVPAGQRR